MPRAAAGDAHNKEEELSPDSLKAVKLSSCMTQSRRFWMLLRLNDVDVVEVEVEVRTPC